MNLFKFDKHEIRQRFVADWKKRNCVTNIILYGIQVAAILCALVMVEKIIGIVCDFCSTDSYWRYEDMTIGGLFSEMLGKGWLPGLVACIVVFFCNQRVIRWKADGVLWLFLLFFGISVSTLAVEDEMFLYFSASFIGGLAIYVLSLLLPKKVGETNKTAFHQCHKPSNWLITLSFIVMLLWLLFISDSICRL